MLCICDFKSQKNIQLRLSSIIICLLLIDLVVYPSSFGSGFMVRKKKIHSKEENRNTGLGSEQNNWLHLRGGPSKEEFGGICALGKE